MNIQSTYLPDIRLPFNEWLDKIIYTKKENPPVTAEGNINNTNTNKDGTKSRKF